MKCYLLLTLFLFSNSVNSASVNLTEGTLTAGSIINNIASGSVGQFSSHSIGQLVNVIDSTGTVVPRMIGDKSFITAQVGSSGFNVSAFSAGDSYFDESFSLVSTATPVNGVLKFDVISGGMFDFLWNNDANLPNSDLTDSSLSIRNLNGGVMLSCASFRLCTDELIGSGGLFLNEGSYILDYNSRAATMAGTIVSSSMNFSLISSVPLPASIWLFMSGLSCLLVFRKRKNNF